MKILRPSSFILLLASLVSFSGCTGIKYSDKVHAVDIGQLDTPETATRVLAAAAEWRNSGVIVKKGAKYKISASGKWSAGALCGATGPDGVGASYMCTGATATLIGIESASLLLGKIGEQGEPFAVGSGLELLADDDGILYFHINDTPMMMSDNSG